MKLKYYLRGLGIGIIATTIILMISFSMHNEEMSDEQIIARAEALGMEFPEESLFPEGTEESETSEFTESSEEVKESEETSESENLQETENSELSETSEKEENTEETGSEENSEAEDEVQAEAVDVENATNVNSEIDTDLQNNSENAVQPEGKYELVIQRGVVCRDICEELFQNGLVDDSEAFRVYLGNVGYASNISIGKYQIPYGLSYEEIYHILKAGPMEEE